VNSPTSQVQFLHRFVAIPIVDRYTATLRAGNAAETPREPVGAALGLQVIADSRLDDSCNRLCPMVGEALIHENEPAISSPRSEPVVPVAAGHAPPEKPLPVAGEED
jgi:hypothetical protein